MDQHASVISSEESLARAAADVAGLKKRYAAIAVTDQGRLYNTDLMEAVELGFLLDVADVMVASAACRRESRGAHFRADYPARDDARFLQHTLAFRAGPADDRWGSGAGRWTSAISKRRNGATRSMSERRPAHPAAVPVPEPVVLKIRRFDPETETEPRWERYEVPVQPGDRLLDALHWVKWNLDGSLAFRRACGQGHAARTSCASTG